MPFLLPQNRNLACVKNKQEILQQLRELIKSESHLSDDCEETEPIRELQAFLPQSDNQCDNLCPELGNDATFTNTSNVEASELQWNNNDWHEATDPSIFPYGEQVALFSALTTFPGDAATDFSSSACLGSGGDGHPISLAPKRPLELLCPDRDSVLSRYKEKRKTRRYDKLIRYETRKARADSRVRIKGRFAKVHQDPKP